MYWVKTNNIDKIYNFNFSKKNNQTPHALKAAIDTVIHISKNYPAPYTLFLSGGVDSQAMLWAFHLSKIPFQTLSAVYNYNLNDHDLVTIKQFADLHGIFLNFTNFDLFHFLETEFVQYSDRYLCGSPQICAFMKLADELKEGTVIMSGNFISNNYVTLPPNVMGLWHYQRLSGRSVIPFFFLETEDLAWAFNDYSILINSKNSVGLNYENRVNTYQHFNFPVISQGKKYNGFERVKEWFDTNYTKPIPIENRISKIAGQGSNRVFDLLYRNKFEVKFSQYKYVYTYA
jgi:hypothetical protein